MKIVSVTVSFMNDFDEHAEWLDVLFGSLKNNEDHFEVFDHLIVLNDYNQDVAEKNIKSIIDSYDIEGYSCKFLKNPKNSGKFGLSHHAHGIEKALKYLRAPLYNSDYDGLLILEQDMFLRDNFFDYLSDLDGISRIHQSIIGLVGDMGGVEHRSGRFKISLPRLKPHFLYAADNVWHSILDNSDGFMREPILEWRQKTISDNFILSEDTGTTLYKRLVNYQNIFSISHYDNKQEFYRHLFSISVYFKRLINSQPHIINLLLTKFKEVREMDIDSFRENSIFKKYTVGEYEQILRELYKQEYDAKREK